jgi:hypothetical protein
MVVGGNVLVRGVPVDRHLHLRVSVRVVAEFGGQHLLEVLKGPLNADSKYSHALQNKEARDVTEEQRRRFRRRRCVVVQRLACSRRLLRGGVQGWSEPKIDVRVGSVRALHKLLRVYSVHWDPSARQGGGHTGGQYDAVPSSFMVQ